MNDRPWQPILDRLTHPDIWGPGGLVPLDAFHRAGDSWLARCPSGQHPDRHPSFRMRPGRPAGFCWSCRHRVGWIQFVQDRLGLDFKAAVDLLADRAGLPRPAWNQPASAHRPDAFQIAADWLRRRLQDDTPVAHRCRQYLHARQVSLDVLPALPLGCLPAPADAVRMLAAAGVPPSEIRRTGLGARYLGRTPLVFVYTDGGGQVAGFKGRAPDPGQKRILNAPGFAGAREAQSPYCLDLARPAIQQFRRAILVEGEFDALTWQSWFLSRGRVTEVVAIGGTAKPRLETFRALAELAATSVVLALDADPAGRRSTALAITLAWQAGLEPLVCPMPDGRKDPDEVFAASGPAAGIACLGDPRRLIAGWQRLVDDWIQQAPPDSAAGAAALLIRAREAAQWAPATAREALARALAERLGLQPDSVARDLQDAAEAARQARVRTEIDRWARAAQSVKAETLPEALAHGQALLTTLRQSEE